MDRPTAFGHVSRCDHGSEQGPLEGGKVGLARDITYDRQGRDDARSLRRSTAGAGFLAIDRFDDTFGVALAIGMRPRADCP